MNKKQNIYDCVGEVVIAVFGFCSSVFAEQQRAAQARPCSSPLLACSPAGFWAGFWVVVGFPFLLLFWVCCFIRFWVYRCPGLGFSFIRIMSEPNALFD